MYLEHSDHARGKRLRAPRPRDRPIASAALDEVEKFIPSGTSTAPASAFWTAVGKQVQARFGGQMNIESLRRLRAYFLISSSGSDE